MFERFTDRARRVVVLAQQEARMLDHNYIATEHILLGLIHEGEGVAARALLSLDISPAVIRQQVEAIIGQGEQAPSPHIPFTPGAKKALELSLQEAAELGHFYIGTEHILLGLIREGEGVAAQVLVQLGADLTRVREQVVQLLHAHTGRPGVGEGAAGIALGKRRRAPGELWLTEMQNSLARIHDTLDAIERHLGMRDRGTEPDGPPAGAQAAGPGDTEAEEPDDGEGRLA
jgi:ATP-dependent Clp protease ATP-binding subunit ClpA